MDAQTTSAAASAEDAAPSGPMTAIPMAAASSMGASFAPFPIATHTSAPSSATKRGLVVSRSDRLRLQAELLRNGTEGPERVGGEHVHVEQRRDLREPFRNAVDQHAAIGERSVDVEDEILQRE